MGPVCHELTLWGLSKFFLSSFLCLPGVGDICVPQSGSTIDALVYIHHSAIDLEEKVHVYNTVSLISGEKCQEIHRIEDILNRHSDEGISVRISNWMMSVVAVPCTEYSVVMLSVITRLILLTYWDRVMHICISKLTIIGSNNGLSPGRRQAFIWTSAGVLLFVTSVKS